jgi:type I restriction enzyme R subunit
MKRNQNPEQIARDRIDEMLRQSGWLVQSKKEMNINAGKGVAIREYQTDVGPADYVLFVDRKAVGIIEAKREEEGHRLTVVEDQSKNYAIAKLKYLNNDPLPFVYESTGVVTRFRDFRDPKPRGRRVFSFHRPETMAAWLKQEKSLRGRLLDIPALDEEGLRPAQIVAIKNLEKSFQNNRPKALIQMATGAGKTFTAATFIYRLLKHAKAKRILFLVDTKNLGEQAEQEFLKYQPKDDNRKFTELYNVQRLSSSYIASDSQVCISTIQRLYSILKGEEMGEDAELDNPNESTWLENRRKDKTPLPVVYNKEIPIEQFDFVIIDECHRSIYNLWKQVLDYFDAFLIGLTATPDKRTFGFFNENVVSEYTYEESVTDGVNVPHEIYDIRTETSENGNVIQSGWFLERRDKISRKKRWQREDQEINYKKNDLDKKVVNPSQIRNIIKEFKKVLETKIYPDRWDEKGEYEVPKTLVFAKTDSHADDIIKIIREEFNEGDEFCKKVTYKISEDPKSVLNRFRNSYYPRIAVTVDMIATGTDVKPLEVLLFMRDVKSINYFEQMKGRGTRTIKEDDLQKVSKTAHHKTHFVIVDAVGVSVSKKTDSRPLERKRGVPLKDLLGAATMGIAEEDLCLSLADRLIRLEKQITPKQKEELLEYTNGKNLKQITKELLDAHDPDVIEARAEKLMQKQALPNMDKAKELAQEELQRIATSTFNGKLNDFLDNARKQHEQIIDTINIDSVTKSEWNKDSLEQAEQVISDFKAYIEEHKEEIEALAFFYNLAYRERGLHLDMIEELLQKMKADRPTLAPQNVWDAYALLDNKEAKKPKQDIMLMMAILRRLSGMDESLTPYSKTIDKNFQTWVFGKQAGTTKYSEEQMAWLRMLKDHIATNLSIETDDLDYTPFDAHGGRGKMWQLFGEEMNAIIEELNTTLVA